MGGSKGRGGSMGKRRKKSSKSSSGRGAGSGGRGRRAGSEVSEARLKALFSAVDKDGSGKIDAEELGLALSNGGLDPFNEATLNLAIGFFDKDGDGVIGFSEFKNLWKYLQDWTEVFRKYDADGNGAIGKKELGTALKSFGYRLSPAFVGFLVARFDRTEGGQLLFDDFVQACVLLHTVTEVFKARDADRTGVVNYAYEDFVQDAIGLVFRLQATPAPAEED